MAQKNKLDSVKELAIIEKLISKYKNIMKTGDSINAATAKRMLENSKLELKSQAYKAIIEEDAAIKKQQDLQAQQASIYRMGGHIPKYGNGGGLDELAAAYNQGKFTDYSGLQNYARQNNYNYGDISAGLTGAGFDTGGAGYTTDTFRNYGPKTFEALSNYSKTPNDLPQFNFPDIADTERDARMNAEPSQTRVPSNPGYQSMSGTAYKARSVPTMIGTAAPPATEPPGGNSPETDYSQYTARPREQGLSTGDKVGLGLYGAGMLAAPMYNMWKGSQEPAKLDAINVDKSPYESALNKQKEYLGKAEAQIMKDREFNIDPQLAQARRTKQVLDKNARHLGAAAQAAQQGSSGAQLGRSYDSLYAQKQNQEAAWNDPFRRGAALGEIGGQYANIGAAQYGMSANDAAEARRQQMFNIQSQAQADNIFGRGVEQFGTAAGQAGSDYFNYALRNNINPDVQGVGTQGRIKPESFKALIAAGLIDKDGNYTG